MKCCDCEQDAMYTLIIFQADRSALARPLCPDCAAQVAVGFGGLSNFGPATTWEVTELERMYGDGPK